MKLEYESFKKGGRALPDAVAKLIWPMAALVLLLLFNLIFTAGFFRIEIRDGHLYGSLIDVLNRGSQVMLLSLGMTLVLATGGVDLSVGAIMAISGAIAVELVRDPNASLFVAVPAALLISIIAGAWNGVLVSFFRIQPIIATLILMVAGRGVAQLITQGFIPLTSHEGFSFIGNGHLFALPFPVTIVAGMFALTWVATRKTAVGLFIEAIGDNERASHFAGINPRTVKFLVYTFTGLCAGLAGLLYASNIKAADSNNAGRYFELDAILAVVVGGTALTGGRFYLLGSIVGALFIQTLTTTMYARNVSSDIAPMYKAIVILAVCLIQSPVLRRQIMAPFAAARRPA